MPAVSGPQQHLMGMALAYKRGDLHKASPEIRKVAGSMSESQLHDFAATKGFAAGGGIGSHRPEIGIGASHRIADVPFHSGLIGGSGAGRTDRLPLSVQSESHVIPADVVSSVGQGSTEHGSKILEGSLASTGPWGVAPPKMVRGHGPPAPPHLMGMAEGGRTSILAASAEVVVPPADVLALGERGARLGQCQKGETPMDCGHRLIDEMIARVRKDQIAWLRRAPDPKK